uniref:Kinetochore protein SPC25 n=1 Tax=Xiphophorus couchianus TaxID=32473 RepID=A0A3B5MZ50_9TELE
MTSITDPSMRDRFTSSLEEIRNNHLKAYAEIIDTISELSHNHRQFVNSAVGKFQCINHKKKIALKEKRRAISEVMSEIEEKEMQKEDIILKIQKHKEEQMKRKDLIESQNRANKDRLRNLQKARLVFQDHLGLEIRTIIDKTQMVKGEKLQFIFRNISLSDQDSAYVITMGIKENGSYQIVSSDPALECLPILESRLQETNNLPAFLANVRKEFISKARS